MRNPQNYAFGKSEEMGGGKIAQQVLLTGPDGKEYEALYTLELQPDGVWRITGVQPEGVERAQHLTARFKAAAGRPSPSLR